MNQNSAISPVDEKIQRIRTHEKAMINTFIFGIATSLGGMICEQATLFHAHPQDPVRAHEIYLKKTNPDLWQIEKDIQSTSAKLEAYARQSESLSQSSFNLGNKWRELNKLELKKVP